jgi:hypothetical protein
MLEQFSDWLLQTELKAFLSDTTHVWTWMIIPMSQTIHIVSVAFLMISVAILNVRLLGFGGRRQSFAQLLSSLMPWIWVALAALLVTGTIQTIAEPARELMSNTFRLKMVLLAIVVAITIVYKRAVAGNPRYWDESPERRRIARVLASFSLVLWLGIAAAGRLIAYV